MEFEDQEEHDEEMEMEPSYDSLVNNNGGGGGGGRVRMASSAAEAAASAAAQLQQQQQQTRRACRYRECLKNHAVGIGGHALDGCGEFLAAGAEGTLDALKCAACNCHRNFHRKETDEPYGQLVPHQGHVSGHHSHHHGGFGHPQFSASGGYYRTPGGYLHVTTQHRPLALPSTSGGGGTDQDDDMSNPSGGGGGGGSGFGMGMGTTSSKKRFRTKFSQEQKERMLELADRLGWRIQKQDEAAVQSFCDETGVKRHVLKVWMHNNKHTLGKKP
ncbi:putative transcription factor ZF-HD family [Rosa chinensis]|uniref:Putative transcription factor ZF-HD family n=1 Tax=Rosa chinensis TaxID=74649 RepID=A0A2P6RQ40_ROSCH|nr:zinc-finger homeodomain protein 2 [Rosa chinensis]PRQ48556.1 putative transcription factor ZF-HD family [Rosa chinensis]